MVKTVFMTDWPSIKLCEDGFPKAPVMPYDEYILDTDGPRLVRRVR